MFLSVHDAKAGLSRTGYITDEITATIVYLAARLNKPVLLEGPPGSGKTQLAYAVAEATGAEIERMQCYEGVNEEKAIGKFDEPLQRLAVELRSRSGSCEWETLKEELHGEKFFSAGPLLRALRHPRRCVLLIDELDKVSLAFEAQAFKRAASCFGLGRYLYYFTGIWVDLDERKRPKTRPSLAGWATPDGWRQGLRPQQQSPAQQGSQKVQTAKETVAPAKGEPISDERGELIRQVEAMAEPLGKRLYRGLLKRVARAWKPSDISEAAILRTLLADMQEGDRILNQLAAILSEKGAEQLPPILRSLGFYSMEQVDNLDALGKILASFEP